MGTLIEGDVHFTGNVSFGGQVSLPTGAVTAAKVAASAAIEPTKFTQRQRLDWNQGNSDDTVVTKTFPIHVVTGATGTLREFKAGCVTVCTSGATITVDLKKNGASVLSAVITLDNTQTARQVVAAAISTMSVAVGDVLEVAVTATAGGGTLGKGLFGTCVIDEAPQ